MYKEKNEIINTIYNSSKKTFVVKSERQNMFSIYKLSDQFSVDLFVSYFTSWHLCFFQTYKIRNENTLLNTCVQEEISRVI